MKRILIHTLVFSPDGDSTAYLYNDIALALQGNGWDVTVVTTTPHFNAVAEQLQEQPLRWRVPGMLKESRYHGMRVFHVPQKKFRRSLLRMAGFVYWHAVSFFLILCMRRVDVILSPSPPPTIGELNLWIGRLKRCRVVYNVQEIYPDLLEHHSGVAYRMLSRMERRIYARSDAVTAIDRVFADTIAGRFSDPGRLHVIPNFVDTGFYRPGTGHEGLDPALFPETDSLRVVYAGNIGLAQSWDPLIELAERCRERAIDFFVVGEGAMKRQLEEAQAARGLPRLHILPYQPHRLMPQILDYADLHFVFMNPGMGMHGFPSKVYSVMACAKPLLVWSGAGTPVVKFLQNIGCAKIVTTPEIGVAVEDMAAWLAGVTTEKLRAMGAAGLQEVTAFYTKEIVTRQYVDLLNSLVESDE